MKNLDLGIALIASNDTSTILELKPLLKEQGYKVLDVGLPGEAIGMFAHEQPNAIFIDVGLPGKSDIGELTKEILALVGNRFVPIIFLLPDSNEESFKRCIDSGGHDFLVKPFNKYMLEFKIYAMQRISALNQKLQGMYSMIHREQEIAESVFINAIQGANISSPMIKNKIRPAGTFSGDMILSAYSPTRDLFILIGDFTGHGLSAAIGAMPVSEVFHAMTAKGFSPEDILIGINKKLRALLPTGMFFGVQLVAISGNLERANIFNAGMPDLLIIDSEDNAIKHRVKSGGLPLGIIDNIKPRDFRESLPIKSNDKILMFSDGLPEARNADDEVFGDDRLQQSISNTPGNDVYNQIFADLDAFCGGMVQVDDVTLVEITCAPELIPDVAVPEHRSASKNATRNSGEWQLTLKFTGMKLRETNPVPILLSQILEMEALEGQRQSLFTVITELYVNALDHGVLGLDSSMKSDAAGFARYYEEREARLTSLKSGYIIFDLSVEQRTEGRNIELRIEDSGDGFDFQNHRALSADNTLLCGRGILLVEDLCDSLTYKGRGNIVKATIDLNRA